MNHPTQPWHTALAGKTELDALLDRVREDKADPTGKNRTAVAYDCWRMFEDLATRYKEEFAMRDRYKAQSNSWRDKALSVTPDQQLGFLIRDVLPVLRAVTAGYTYDPGSSDLDDEQHIDVSMTLGDYRRASRLKYELERA